MIQTVYELIEAAYPEVVKLWDRYDYKIHAPVSLDDAPTIQITLKNRNKSQVMLQIPLQKQREGIQTGWEGSSPRGG